METAITPENHHEKNGNRYTHPRESSCSRNTKQTVERKRSKKHSLSQSPPLHEQVGKKKERERERESKKERKIER